MKNRMETESGYEQYVDVFYGSGAVKLPKPEGIAATWFFLNGQCGNTYPHASLPFGKMSCGLYTGGYPTGYGNHMVNYGGCTETFTGKAHGFSHLHQTGTGEIRVYYNYAVATPLYGELREVAEDILEETGSPGYYTAMFAESKIRTELTVSENTAYHRYHFAGEGKIMIDFSNDGLDRSLGEGTYAFAENACIKIESGNAISAEVTLHGVRFYFYVTCVGTIKDAYLYQDYKSVADREAAFGVTDKRFGGVFAVDGECVLCVSVSEISMEHAKELASEKEDFDTVRKKAAQIWNQYLGKIEVDADERTKRLFYSNLYHCLQKPARWEKGFTDFSTLWDLYKTQLPLVYTLFRQESIGIRETLAGISTKSGRVPVAVMHTSFEYVKCFEEQAKMLATLTLADAYYRGVCPAQIVLDTALRELDFYGYRSTENLPSEESYTHLLDVAQACRAAEKIAREIKDYKKAEYFKKYADAWREAFDADGLLKEGRCYEGDRWNYSFRLLPDMEQRIALCGGKEKFTDLADSFFGYGKEAVVQCKNLEEEEYQKNCGLHRFDGLNNEHDMEAPYVYHFADRHDRVCEVVEAVKKYMFAEGRGGIPGNNDSGALSSWYVWNTLGLFPVSGQDKILLGIPGVKRAKMHLSNGKVLEIETCGKGAYVEKATWNGEDLPKMELSVREMMEGGELTFFL